MSAVAAKREPYERAYVVVRVKTDSTPQRPGVVPFPQMVWDVIVNGKSLKFTRVNVVYEAGEPTKVVLEMLPQDVRFEVEEVGR